MQTKGRSASASAIVWVALVLGVGVLLGSLLALTVPPQPGPPGPGAGPGAGPAGVARLGVLLSTVDLGLLVALLAVYGRTYTETRARFALGIAVFLGALTVQTLFGSPLLFGAFGYGPGGLGPFLGVSYFAETIGLVVFLFLSLD